jgi:type I restriction enzyme S subunit
MECTQNRSENMSGKATTEKSKTEKAESLPEGWKNSKVGELFYLGRGRIISESYIKDHEGIYPVFSSQTEKKGELGRIDSYDFDGEYISWTTDGANAGTVFYRSGRFNATNVCGLAKPKNSSISVKFFSYLLSTLAKNYVSYIGNPKLMNNVFYSIPVKCPPLAEQCKIAEILETVDNAIEKTDAIIEKYRRIKKGLMADLLTGKIRLIPYGHSEAECEESPLLTSAEAKKFVIGDKTIVAVPNQKWKNTPIGKIPEEWEVRKLGEILQYKQPTAYIVKNENYDEKSGIPVLTAGKTFILGYTAEEFGIFDETPVIIFDDFTTESRFVDFPFKVKSSALKILKLKDYQSNLYFIYNLMQIIPFKPGSEHKRFWISEYSKIQIPLPPLPEQQLIADVLSQVDEVIEKEIQYKEKLERIKKGLMEDLLTGKVRVNNLIKEDIQNDTKVL